MTAMQEAYDSAKAVVMAKGIQVPVTIAHVQSGWTRKTKPEHRRNRLMFIVSLEAQRALGWPNHRFMYSVEGTARRGLKIVPDDEGMLSIYKYNNTPSLTGSINATDVGTWPLYKHGRETFIATAKDGVLELPALPKRYWDSWTAKRDMRANGIDVADKAPEVRAYEKKSAAKVRKQVKRAPSLPAKIPARSVPATTDSVDDLRVAVGILNDSISKVADATLRVEDNRAVVEVRVVETFR